jgi:glutathione S-transferase
MKIFFSATSPFVRKCLVVAHELGLRDRIELLPGAPHPVNRDATIVAHNPLGKVPTLIADDGMVLYDSRVICEYLDALGDGALIPERGPARWHVLTEQSLADGITDAAVLARYETAMRPQSLRWTDWTTGQLDKVRCGLTELERLAPGFVDRVDVGTIAIGCSLGYLDYRYGSLAWREKCPVMAAWFERFGGRPSMLATCPPAV